MRLNRRAEITLEMIEFSRSRAKTLRGARARGESGLEALDGFFLFWFGRCMTIASSPELREFLEPSCKHHRNPL